MSDRKPFEPADGETARWRKLYELVLSKQPNDQITYREVEDLLDCDRAAALGAMYQANARLEQDGQRSVRNERNYGWIVCRASDQLREVGRRMRKTRNQIRRTVRVADAAHEHRDELSQFEREDLDRSRLAATRLHELTSRSKRSLSELAKRDQAIRELPKAEGA